MRASVYANFDDDLYLLIVCMRWPTVGMAVVANIN